LVRDTNEKVPPKFFYRRTETDPFLKKL